MRIWTLLLALLVATIVADVAEAGRRCGRRRRCCGGGCAVATTCAGGVCATGSCSVGGYAAAQVAPGYSVAADWTNGYPGVGYTGTDYGTFAGYRPGTFYGR